MKKPLSYPGASSLPKQTAQYEAPEMFRRWYAERFPNRATTSGELREIYDAACRARTEGFCPVVVRIRKERKRK